jgi:hypothetical protein
VLNQIWLAVVLAFEAGLLFVASSFYNRQRRYSHLGSIPPAFAEQFGRQQQAA